MTRPLRNLCEVAVVGGGLAGLSAARHLARLGRLVTLFEPSGMFGGQVATVDAVWGLPLPQALSGQDLAIPMLEDARKVGVRIVEAAASALESTEGLTLRDDAGGVYRPAATIVATGGRLRRLDVPGEAVYEGRGVSRCASCDGGFFRDQVVAVIGGGDAAVHEALLLAKTSREVVMICRTPARAKREYLDRLAARRNVRFVWDSVVTEISGDADGANAVLIRNLRNGGEERIECAGVFPFVGIQPNGGWLPADLLDANGLIVTNDSFASADPRIFAVGAARAGYGGNAIQAMAEGVGAAEAVSRLLEVEGECA